MWVQKYEWGLKGWKKAIAYPETWVCPDRQSFVWEGDKRMGDEGEMGADSTSLVRWNVEIWLVTEPTRAPAGQEHMSTKKHQENSFSHNKKIISLASIYNMLVFFLLFFF